MKLLGNFRIICKCVSVSTLAISVIRRCDYSGIKFVGEMSTCSISKTFPSLSSFSPNATTLFSSNYKYLLLLRFTVTNGVTDNFFL